MIRLILALLPLALPAPAWAEWVKYAESNGVAQYYDPAIEKRDHVRQVEVLQDFVQGPAPMGERSRRIQFEYDCKKEQYRGLSATRHAGPMATGALLAPVTAPDKWRDIRSGTAGGALLRIVCK